MMSDEPNEILEAAKAAKAHQDAGADKAKASDKARRWQLGGIVGVGIGSAAVAAALLFANGKKR
jgi:hypothetical protein